MRFLKTERFPPFSLGFAKRERGDFTMALPQCRVLQPGTTKYLLK
ncbi:hypothetical protein [Spirosoma sp. KCTC 42546]|nr:hypothetical protein [Spirosoma sp. KCTC 42546]